MKVVVGNAFLGETSPKSGKSSQKETGAYPDDDGCTHCPL